MSQSKFQFKSLTRSALFLILASQLSGCGYNKLQGLDEEVKASWAEVQNQFQRRTDLVPNLVETVKGAAKQERETLTAVMEARAKATSVNVSADQLSDPAAVKKYQAAQSGLSSALSRLMVVVEKYPDLKSNQGFRDLQIQLEGTENRISVARNRYIEQVAEYNKGVRFFPTNLTAKYMLHLEPRESFQAEAGAEKAPQVKF
ncbi:MAG: LemA family protein [Proteobacteria bacterium]|nr:MAG: LemA family protein [Pseudomonadota bacterium]